MDRKTLVKSAGIGLGAIVALTLVSQHPVAIVLLGAGAAAYFYAEKYL